MLQYELCYSLSYVIVLVMLQYELCYSMSYICYRMYDFVMNEWMELVYGVILFYEREKYCMVFVGKKVFVIGGQCIENVFREREREREGGVVYVYRQIFFVIVYLVFLFVMINMCFNYEF